MNLEVQGVAYIGDEQGDEYWAEHVHCTAEVERTDENEIRLGIALNPGESDSATLYLTLAEASRLSHMLGLAVLTPVQLGAGV